MSKIEKYIRNFADLVGGSFGMVDSDSNKNNSPLWSVIAMAFIGVIGIVLLVLAAYAVLT